MTLTAMILKDIEANHRAYEAEMARKSLKAYEREITRRVWARRIKSALPFALVITALAVATIIFW